MKKFLLDWWVKIEAPFKADNLSPNYLAISVSLGIAVGLMPIWGQAYFCFIFWAVFKRFEKLRFNLVLSCACTFISNPLTTPFMTFGYYVLGNICLMQKSLTFGEFITQAKDIVDSTSTFTIKLRDGFDFAFGDVGLPIAIGYVIAAAIAAPLSYIVSYKIALIYKKRNAKRIANS
ncbi:MAG: DUF2062 domain-containing protein [Opitutales bacterium]|nr:DUF2062 domain-containing protein [Opitutales bacterium]